MNRRIPKLKNRCRRCGVKIGPAFRVCGPCRLQEKLADHLSEKELTLTRNLVE